MITKLRIRIIYVTKLWNNYMMIISIIIRILKKWNIYIYIGKNTCGIIMYTQVWFPIEIDKKLRANHIRIVIIGGRYICDRW